MANTFRYIPNYDAPSVPQSVRELKPILFKEDQTTFCCRLGEDPQAGIFGCGHTPEEAMEDWDNSYQRLLQKAPHLANLITSKAYSYEWLKEPIQTS